MALAAGALLEPPQKQPLGRFRSGSLKGWPRPRHTSPPVLLRAQSGGEVIRSSFGQDACRVRDAVPAAEGTAPVELSGSPPRRRDRRRLIRSAGFYQNAAESDLATNLGTLKHRSQGQSRQPAGIRAGLCHRLPGQRHHEAEMQRVGRAGIISRRRMRLAALFRSLLRGSAHRSRSQRFPD